MRLSAARRRRGRLRRARSKAVPVIGLPSGESPAADITSFPLDADQIVYDRRNVSRVHGNLKDVTHLGNLRTARAHHGRGFRRDRPNLQWNHPGNCGNVMFDPGMARSAQASDAETIEIQQNMLELRHTWKHSMQDTDPRISSFSTSWWTASRMEECYLRPCSLVCHHRD